MSPAIRGGGGSVREADGALRAFVVSRQQHVQDHAAARRARHHVWRKYGITFLLILKKISASCCILHRVR